MRTQAADIGLAIIGGGRVGLFRGEVANRHPAVKWIGLAEKNPNRAGDVAPKIGADFVTQSHVELLKRPEVTCAIIATDEHLHVEPIMAAVERGIPLLIEKPLATDLAQSAKVLKAIKDAKIDAVVGYTQRFRRKWLAGKEKVRTGALGEVTLVTSRAFMNRLVAIDNYKRTDDPKSISPMVISGTHALDMCMWYLEKKTPVECYARSIDKVLGPLYQGIDATAGMIMMSDNSVYHLNISWALPVTWPGAVYSLEVGIVGTDGVLTIDDTHRDMVLAVSKPQGEGYAPDQTRLVDFLGSYPPGDMALGELRGPMADETMSWLNRVALGLPTPAATVEEAHNNLMLTKALDLSAKRKQPVKLPLDPDEEKRSWHGWPSGRATERDCIEQNTDNIWGWPAKLLHWIGAILILLLLGHGWWMTHLAPRGPDGSSTTPGTPRSATISWRCWCCGCCGAGPTRRRTARRHAAMGAHSGAYQPYRALSADVRHDAARLGAGRHGPHSIQQGCVRPAGAADLHQPGSGHARPARRLAQDPGLHSGGAGGRASRGGAAAPLHEAQQCAAAHVVRQRLVT